MKFVLFTFLLSSGVAFAAEQSSFCAKKALSLSRMILNQERFKIAKAEIKTFTSEPVKGEQYNDESFDVLLKGKNDDRCITMKFNGSQKDCTLLSYRFPGCH